MVRLPSLTDAVERPAWARRLADARAMVPRGAERSVVRSIALTALIGAACSGAWSCATLEQLRALVQAPTFEEAQGQPSEIRLLPPGAAGPLGGAGVRIWTKVTNPNSFGVRLGTLAGTLFVEGNRAANADFPMGLPLGPGEESVVPIDLSISFADLPGLANVIRRAANNEALDYRLDGTIGVDAGRLGTPTFGPMTLLRGKLRAR